MKRIEKILTGGLIILGLVFIGTLIFYIIYADGKIIVCANCLVTKCQCLLNQSSILNNCNWSLTNNTSILANITLTLPEIPSYNITEEIVINRPQGCPLEVPCYYIKNDLSSLSGYHMEHPSEIFITSILVVIFITLILISLFILIFLNIKFKDTPIRDYTTDPIINAQQPPIDYHTRL